MVKRVFREAALYAHHFIEVAPNRATLTEIYRWDKAQALVDEVRSDPELPHEADACRTFWNDVRRDPRP
jgi:hypothetical protein